MTSASKAGRQVIVMTPDDAINKMILLQFSLANTSYKPETIKMACVHIALVHPPQVLSKKETTWKHLTCMAVRQCWISPWTL